MKKSNCILKRILALACCLSVFFGTVHAKQTENSSASNLTSEELYSIELLNVIGIYDGVDSIIGKDAFVRRDVFAFLVARIMGMDDISYTGDSNFSDVGNDNFAYNAINVLYQNKIIKGNNKKYEPKRDITLTEASEALLRVLGYSELLDLSKNKVANELIQKHELYKGIEITKDKRLSVRNLSKLLYNALISEYPQPTSFSDDGGYTYEVKKGENLLSTIYNIYSVEGVITANDRTSIDVSSGLGNSWIKIDDKKFNIGKTQADKYIGYYVIAYYIEGECDMLVCIDVETENQVVVLDSHDIEYDNFRYTSYQGNKKKTYNISKGLNLIYNNKAIYYDKNKMVPKYGTVTLVSNNKDKNYETVIVNDVKTIVVESYSVNLNIIKSQYNDKSIDLNQFDETEYLIHKIDGKAFKLNSLKKGDVLSVLESADGEYIEITVSTDTVTGTINGISESDGIITVDIDGKEYDVAEEYSENGKYELAFEYAGTFYLDMYGRIAGAVGKTNQLKWGYVLKTLSDSDTDTIQIKMLTEDSGTIKIVKTADKFFVDDVKYSSSNPDAFTLTQYRPIRYREDKDGNIKRISTVGNGFIEQKAKYADGFALNAFGNNIALNSNTVIMQIPNTTRAGDDPTDESFYALKPLNSFKNGDWYWVNSFAINPEDVTASLVLIERFYASADNPSGTYMVVSEVSTAVNSDDCVVEKISGYDSSKKFIEIYTRELGVAKKYGIEKNDVFSMVLYPDGTLNRGAQVYDYKTNVLSTKYSSIAYDLQNNARFGYAYDINGSFLQLSADEFSLYNQKVYSTGAATIAIVDTQKTKNNIMIGSLADIKTIKQNGKASKIVVYVRESIPRFIVAYQ